ncbi:bis(5'-nucleosyl)-tetraphosphatase (symmetrical) YqeK [Lachnospiraceae bacterium C1.1]|nr:bis(5'-nucleosyl)-tetraphosphatase (symmetrical) YqeK [Lachnospiraceae bacterium C1.1]
MTEEIKAIKKKVKKVLDKDRYQHTLGVAYTAASLAMRYGIDIDRAFLAGILHDCAKNIANDEKFTLCKKYKIKLSDVEKQAPYLIHSKLGACLAREIYKVEDKEILDAVRNHTTGRPGMTVLEKIIFIADYIEPGRTTAPNLSKIRQMSFVDLDKAVIEILKDTLEYLNTKDQIIDPMTQKTYDYYVACTKQV